MVRAANLLSNWGMMSRTNLLLSVWLLTVDLFMALAWWKHEFLPPSSENLTKMVRLSGLVSLNFIFLTHMLSILETRASIASAYIPMLFAKKSITLPVRILSLVGFSVPYSLMIQSLILLKSSRLKGLRPIVRSISLYIFK